MRPSKKIVVALLLLLGACLNNPTIDEEVAEKCGVTVAEYQKAEATLSHGRIGASVQVGRCRLIYRAKGVMDSTIIDESR